MTYIFMSFISLHLGLHVFFGKCMHIYRTSTVVFPWDVDGKGGDSSRDLFIPDHWRSPTTFEWGHVNSPSQKGQKRIAR